MKPNSIIIKSIAFKAKVSSGLEIEYVNNKDNSRDIIRLDSSDHPEPAFVDCLGKVKDVLFREMYLNGKMHEALHVGRITFGRPSPSNPEFFTMQSTGSVIVNTALEPMKFSSPKKHSWVPPTEKQVSDGDTKDLNDPSAHFVEADSNVLTELQDLAICYINGRRQQTELFQGETQDSEDN